MARNIGRLRDTGAFSALGPSPWSRAARAGWVSARRAIRRRNLQDQIEVDDINSPLSETVIRFENGGASLRCQDRSALTDLFHVQGLSLADLSPCSEFPTAR